VQTIMMTENSSYV